MSFEKEERVRGKRGKKKKKNANITKMVVLRDSAQRGGEVGERRNGGEREREFKACVEREARRTCGVEVEKGDVRDMKRGESNCREGHLINKIRRKRNFRVIQ